MDAVLTAAETILRNHPAPALRLPELRERLRAAGPDRRLTDERLRGLLERHPGRFRVLDVWRGPWRALEARSGPAGLERDCWVAVAAGPDAPLDGGLGGRMRESVRWLARRLDARSLHEVSRWHRLALSEEAARAALGRRAA